MKKTLLALAALAATSAAFAQSSVTLYGVVDVSVERVKGDHQVNRVSSSNLASSRLGFKGTEDIGGGLKANFVLETNVKPDTGAQGNTARFFDRSAWVGLAGGAGEVRLGRIDSSIGALAGDSSILGAQAYDDLKIVGTRAAGSYRRVDNGITYILPTVVQGVTAQVQYSTAAGSSSAVGSEAYGSNLGESAGLSVKYASGPILAGLGYLNIKDTTAGAPDNRANATLVYGGYDLGMAKVIAYYDAETAVTGTQRLSVLGVKAIVPVSADLTVQAGISKAKNVAGSTASNDNVLTTAVKAVYKLSKRTSVYALGTIVNNGSAVSSGIDKYSASNTGGVVVSNGTTAGGIAAGVSHAF